MYSFSESVRHLNARWRPIPRFGLKRLDYPFRTALFVAGGWIVALALVPSLLGWDLSAWLTAVLSGSGVWLVFYLRRPRKLRYMEGRELDPAEATKKLRDTGLALRAIVSALPVALVVVDRRGAVRGGWNPAAEELFGWFPADTRGRDLVDLLGGRDSHPLGEVIEEVLEGRRVARASTTLRTRNGKLIEVSATGSPLRFASSEASGALLLFEDRSERQQLEDQLRQAQKLEAIGQLAGGVAHDFNNLLTIIQTNAELLNDPVGVGAEPEDHLAEIQEAVARGADLVRRLMVFSRNEPVRLERMQLDETIERYAGTLSRVLPETIQVHLSVGPNIPAILADAGAVQQILLNLATNARDAMPRGGHLYLELDRGPDDTARLAFRDTGMGMTEEVREKIFEPFFTTKDEDKGTGLGLAMVANLMDQHGGSVTAETAPGEGCEIRLLFPTAPKSAPRPQPQDRKPGEAPRSTFGETILVVEDDPPVRKVLGRALGGLGYVVIMAADGRQAVEAYRHQALDIDLVVSDLIMPRMDGLALHDELREQGATVPFLFISGYSEPDARIQALLDSGTSVLTKPWTVGQLAESVRAVLDQHADSKEGGSPPPTDAPAPAGTSSQEL